MNHVFLRTRTHELLTADFLNGIVQKYHYNREDYALLEKAAFDVLACIRHGEALEMVLSEDYTYADIAYTLGPHVDALLSRYEKEHLILMQLMTEHITAELLMAGYEKFNDYLREAALPGMPRDLNILSLHFWGGEDDYPLSQMTEVLTHFSHLSLTVTPEFYLIPSKSVLCRAKLCRTPSAGDKKESASCAPSIACMNCPRYGTDQCEFQDGACSTN